MERTVIKDIKKNIGNTIRCLGWVQKVRDHSKVVFVVLRDRSGTVQCVAKNENLCGVAKSLNPESIVEITGTATERPSKEKRDEEDVEISIESINVISQAEELPFDLNTNLNIDTLLDNRPITLRSKNQMAIFMIQECVVNAFREYFNKNDFVEFQSPKLVGDDAEGGAGVFKTQYFGYEACLATSPQLYKQIMVGVFERVFTIGNVYRAEKHSTTRHLNEYTSLDFELGFIDDHKDVMKHAEGFIRQAVSNIENVCNEYVEKFDVPKVLLPKETFPLVTLKEAQEIVEKESDEKCVGASDLDPSHERILCEFSKKEYKSDVIFVTHYPISKRPMYTYEDENAKGLTKSFDLLFRGKEIATGGQRIHSYEQLKENIKKRNLNIENFSFYLQAFKYGMPPHGGAGLGLERITAALLGIQNVKEASLFPRDMGRIDKPLKDI
ncbi:MAG: aspartate--tRNA(Asn) ligase [Candidatus Campbellbacteria bacterium]|nr:aspartate--tRNA(Asn) ligase [Candidatus Campbellbacteria bacterium]